MNQIKVLIITSLLTLGLALGVSSLAQAGGHLDSEVKSDAHDAAHDTKDDADKCLGQDQRRQRQSLGQNQR